MKLGGLNIMMVFCCREYTVKTHKSVQEYPTLPELVTRPILCTYMSPCTGKCKRYRALISLV